jgi:SOS-response transcriptional repressor LexA
MDIKEIRKLNLSHLLRSSKKNKRVFAEYVGTDPAYISQLMSEKIARSMGDELARKIESAFGLQHGWMDVSHATEERAHYQFDPVPSGRKIPLISWVQAGNWAEVIDNFSPGDAEEYLDCPVTCSSTTFCLRVRGDSMEPRFHDGEYIFVDPAGEARNKSFVIVRLDSELEATFKQLIVEGEKRYLKPLNPQWPTAIIEINGNATICGVVIARLEKL